MPGPYVFKQIFAADPFNTANVATNASILLFAPGDPAMTPLVITDASTGLTLANPVQTNTNGFGPTFAHETLDQVAWEGGGFTGTFESYRGLKDDAEASATSAATSALAAETAAANAELAAANAAEGAGVALAATVAEAEAAKVAAQAAAGLVGAPAGAAVRAAIQPGGAAHGELSAAIDAQVEVSPVVAGKVSAAIPPLAKFRAGLSLRDTQPVAIVFAGSSTTAGSSATATTKRYANILMKHVQDAYPLATGYLSPATVMSSTVTPPLTEPGAQGLNTAFGGARSNDYLSAAGRTKIAALTARMVIHMIGSNDYANGVTPAAYKTNLAAQLADLRAKQTVPCVHVLVHSYTRGDAAAVAGHVAEDSEFRQVLIELAAAAPSDTFFIDVSEEFASIGIPGADPLGFLDPDLIHMNDKGHAFMADLLRDKLSIPLVRALAVPAPLPSGVVASDSFSGANTATLAGRTMDLAAGGSAKSWGESLANAFAINANTVVRGSATASAFLYAAATNANALVRFKFTTIPSVSSHIVVRRDTFGTGSTSYRLAVKSNGKLQIDKAVAGTVTTITSDSAESIVVGDTVAIKAVGSTISALVNGVEVLTATDTTIASGAYVGFSAGGLANFTLDDFYWEAL